MNDATEMTKADEAVKAQIEPRPAQQLAMDTDLVAKMEKAQAAWRAAVDAEAAFERAMRDIESENKLAAEAERQMLAVSDWSESAASEHVKSFLLARKRFNRIVHQVETELSPKRDAALAAFQEAAKPVWERYKEYLPPVGR